MSWRRFGKYFVPVVMIALLCAASWAAPGEYRGHVSFGGLPVPGATVRVTRGSKTFVTVTDQQGDYSFPGLADGTWKIKVEMLGFSTIQQDVTIAPDTPAANWDLKLLSLEQILAQGNVLKAETQPPPNAPAISVANKSETPSTAVTPAVTQKLQEDAERSSDGLLINGSVNNAATSKYTISPAFGNRRKSGRGMYTGGLAAILDNSVLDARPFSLSGLDTPKATYNRVTGVFTLGGPLNIPYVLPRGPNFFVAYQWTRDADATAVSGLVPSMAERNVSINPQAEALLSFYPLPNVVGNSRYNYQIPILNNTHLDALQSRLDKTLGRRDELYGKFAFESSREDSSNLFGFLDKTNTLGINTSANWEHEFNHGLLWSVGYKFSRLRTQVVPYFANRENVSGSAGIFGNDQDPANWGPPTLVFSSGIASLSDAQSAFNRNETNAVSSSMSWNHGLHNVTFGGDFRRQEFNYLSQQNPRGTFTFTGAATAGSVNGAPVGGSDFADFLLGIPDTSSIAFGNADKYFRESVYDAYATDDWRLRPELTVNAGMRWEYGAPITELYGRLVNLDIASGFSAVEPVLGSDPVGALTGDRYPDSLIRPDKRGIEPRIGMAWRPLPGSSMVVRAGYGIYRDSSVYQTIALQMAQQAPLSKSLNVQNSSACPLTLADGFITCSSITPNTFAVDPNFRLGYAQNWELTVQDDLPGALQLNVTYRGIKGTRGEQEYLPNTYPIGAANPCPSCPAGFVFLASNGDSTREAGEVQLRRRLRSGFTASLQYTYSKSIDDDSVLGGQGPVATSGTTENQSQSQSQIPATPTIAQNWLDLQSERGLSTFDQRHLLSANVQYTSGMGIGGGSLLSGWRGTLLKEWTFLSQITAGSGLPETPIYLAAVPGTGVTGSIRPDLTGAPIYKAPSGLFLNPAAYTAPTSGQWGTAGRNSITGPSQFSLNASLARTFRLKDRYSLDLRVDSTNLLNHAVFATWNTTINSAQFGIPTAANPMRSLQTTLRLRF